MLTANFIGCGKLGSTIAYLLVKNKLIFIQNIFTRNILSAENAVKFIGAGETCTNLTLLKPADLYFICTPDDEIEKICEQIVLQHKANNGAIFIHFSGLLTSDVLLSAVSYGYHVGSLHPLKSFANPAENIKNFQGTFCAFEGSVQAYKIICEFMEVIGGTVFLLQKEQKCLYHAAAVFSSNYLVTLVHIAFQCFKQVGITNEKAKQLVLTLMQGTLTNVENISSIADALTGPLQRGDLNTIQKHITALEKLSEFKDVYKKLGKITLEMTNHKEILKQKLTAELNK